MNCSSRPNTGSWTRACIPGWAPSPRRPAPRPSCAPGAVGQLAVLARHGLRLRLGSYAELLHVPRVGIRRHFGTYDEYIGTVEPMLRSGAIPDPGFLWWDARLRP